MEKKWTELKLPAVFFMDHYERCEEGEIRLLRQGPRTVRALLDDAALDDLKSDADHYAGEFGPDGIEDGGRLIESEKRTVKSLERQLT